MDSTEVEVARYAANISLWALGVSILALVATAGNLGLELRRWFDEGVRLSLNVMAHANMFGGQVEDKNDYLVLSVTNRGSAATTITHMLLHNYPPWVDYRVRRKKVVTMLVPTPVKPGMVGALPYELTPGKVWQGLAVHNSELKRMISEGRLYVGVAASHADKPIMVRVRQWRPPKDAKGTSKERD